jgi:hypothetical protein
MLFFHSTTAIAADTIVRDGFRDGAGNYLTTSQHFGVWLSDIPLDENEGTKGAILLRLLIDTDEAAMSNYEWIEEGKCFREWLVPLLFSTYRSAP